MNRSKQITFLFSCCLLFSMQKNNRISGPENFQPIGEARGDLDKDGIDEKVIVYNTDRKNELGFEREIHIYRMTKGNWRIWHISQGAAMGSEAGGVYGDPFSRVSIQRGCIVLEHFGGSRQKWNFTHRFRFQKGKWKLIGATVHFGAPCDYWEHFDYNLSTGYADYKKDIETCDQSGNQGTYSAENSSFYFKLKSLPDMDGFGPGSNEVKIPESGKMVYY